MMRFSVVTLSCAVAAFEGCLPSNDDVSTEERCLSITREYQAAMPDALICDPAQEAACAAGRPTIVSRQDEDGTITLEGLCLCQHAVNPARTATLDGLLTRFYGAGCTLQPCVCPLPEMMPASCADTGVCVGIWALAP